MACEMLPCQRSRGRASCSLVQWGSKEPLLLVCRLFGTNTGDMATELSRLTGSVTHGATFKLVKDRLAQTWTCQSSHTKHVWCVGVWSGSVGCLGCTGGVTSESDRAFPLVLLCPLASPDTKNPVPMHSSSSASRSRADGASLHGHPADTWPPAAASLAWESQHLCVK